METISLYLKIDPNDLSFVTKQPQEQLSVIRGCTFTLQPEIGSWWTARRLSGANKATSTMITFERSDTTEITLLPPTNLFFFSISTFNMLL